MNTLSVESVRPWYKEPWPWILMAGPFVAILGCSVTIYFAVTQFADQPITEGVVKRGLVVEQIQPAAAAGSLAQPGAAAR